MRRDDLYLNDIVEAADRIATFLGQTEFRELPAIGVGSKRRGPEAGDNRRGSSADFGRDEMPISTNPVAADSRFPQHSDPRIFWDRLE
jgi:hypothetical protein